VSDLTGGEGRGQQLGTRIGTVWTLFQALGLAKENICELESLKRYIVVGCWELKRKFKIRRRSPVGTAQEKRDVSCLRNSRWGGRDLGPSLGPSQRK